ncbi:endonuclease [Empedobacter sp. 225-1]|uniref:endonuclease I family protein n=1 Tax=unclassified Empedobacter TaxID=2643773 RepID=UPI002577B05B|nr:MULTISPECIES: endonuclease [unclassified Empedobacter]MDM1524267.1 endonuclease [Empedobacter sp. 225-1]MDM1544182.1 endonuclease [Empedobacter sp. 189-2]
MRKYLLLLFPFALFAQIPDYYEGIDFKQNGKIIKEELHDIINATHRAVKYTPGVWNILDKSDLDLDSNGRVLLIYGFTDNSTIYSEQRTRDVNNKNNSSSGSTIGKWEREHIFPKSMANPILNTDSPGTGTDAHNLRAVDRQINSTRSNNAYREKWAQDVTGQAKLINGGFYPGDEWTGDVARIIMYMYVHYGMETDPQLVAYNNTTTNKEDRMPDMFLKWNVEDKVSEFEKVRNEIIAETQGSRNPFIDNPYLATLIWGGEKAENTWEELATINYNYQQSLVEVFPNPTNDRIKIKANHFDYANLYDFNGRLIGIDLGTEVSLKQFPKGMYILSIHLKDGKIVTKKVIKK